MTFSSGTASFYASLLALNLKKKSKVLISSLTFPTVIETLKKFVSFDQSQNEIKNKLEQLRALDNQIIINVALAKESSIGVDTEEDFVAIKKIMEYKD